MAEGARSRARRKVSLADVAERAGVSAATVSRTLRGGAPVSDDVRRRVLDAARDLSYVASARTADLNAGPQSTVAVIVPFVSRWFFSAATTAAVDYLRDHGYDVLLYHLGTADVRDRFFSTMPLAGRVNGVLSLSLPLQESQTVSLRALNMPLVSLGSGIAGFPSVGIDDEAAAAAAVNHLVNLRHRRIGFIAGRPDDPRFEFASSPGRRTGYLHALAAAGIEVDERWLVSGPHGPHGGAAAMAELLSRTELPTAVLAEYDELATGALWALRRAGLRVPQDVSVMGIDDHELSEFLDLTTVAQPVGEQGRLAARLLLDQLEAGVADAPQPAAESIQLPTHLVVRGTTAPPFESPPGSSAEPADAPARTVD